MSDAIRRDSELMDKMDRTCDYGDRGLSSFDFLYETDAMKKKP